MRRKGMKIEEIIKAGEELKKTQETKEKEFSKALGEAILKYCKDGVGTVYIDDVWVELYTEKKWAKASFYFKID